MSKFWFEAAVVGDVLFTALGVYVGYKFGARGLAAAQKVSADAIAAHDAVKAAATPVVAAATAAVDAVKKA